MHWVCNVDTTYIYPHSTRSDTAETCNRMLGLRIVRNFAPKINAVWNN